MFSELTAQCAPYTHFAPSLAQPLSELTAQLVGTENPDATDKADALSAVLSAQAFQNTLHAQQRKISAGFDSLLVCAAVLLAVAVSLIVFRQAQSRAELEKVRTVSNEHAKFSRNLHDGVAQDLAAVRTYLQKGDKEKTAFYLNRAFGEVRYLIDSLHLSLTSPLETLLRETFAAFEANYDIKTDIQIISNMLEKLDAEAALEILHITQEALSNIARHAASTEVSLKITDVADELHIRIHDNGIGFDEERLTAEGTADRRKHWGLRNIRDRVEALHGTVKITNEGGCTIAITLTHIVH